ncbi:MAG: hypothetical protein ACRDU9_10290, partial [Acidimicrobiia bacterium]
MAQPLEPDAPTRSEMTRAVLDHLNEWFERAKDMDASGADLDQATLEALRAPPTESGRPLEGILEDLSVAGQDGIYHPSGGHLS